ncbi:putative type II PKS ketosynthase alpha subunit [Anopheles sinensis]|uniref:Putative type II PKS ketosynthase alpha subunit n=1 Tax=Anopheles sinensis TaxID=74873 RepID=A0A084WQE0_ANOSI|nr:putative type II PKS ketosynthase alpha subunit [Anopheles sinensis]
MGDGEKEGPEERRAVSEVLLREEHRGWEVRKRQTDWTDPLGSFQKRNGKMQNKEIGETVRMKVDRNPLSPPALQWNDEMRLGNGRPSRTEAAALISFSSCRRRELLLVPRSASTPFSGVPESAWLSCRVVLCAVRPRAGSFPLRWPRRLQVPAFAFHRTAR